MLVALTLLGALPVYRRVAEESPHGEGSIAMLERLLSFWKGKLFVLALLGFAATDFIITMTLSAADATAHLVENPHLPGVAARATRCAITLVLLALLGAVFLRGFTEAIGVAVALVGVYLALNVVVIAVVAVARRHRTRSVVADWTTALTAAARQPADDGRRSSLLVFPKLALGLSGFETGVAVMPHVEGDPGRHRGSARRPDPRHQAAADHRRGDHERLPGHQQPRHHPADPAGGVPARRRRPTAGRWPTWRTSTSATASAPSTTSRTIAILWFAGASAMAGLLNLIPRYLPRYGMAPSWAAGRPPAGPGPHRDRLPGHLDLRRRRRRPGRRLRHRRAGADHLRRGRGDPRRPARRAARLTVALRGRSRRSSSTRPWPTSSSAPTA